MVDSIDGELSRSLIRPNANSPLQHESPPCVVAILNVRCPAFHEIVRGVKVSTDTTLAQLLLHLTSEPELVRCRDALLEASATTSSENSSSDAMRTPNNCQLCGVVDATLHPPRPVCGSSEAYPLTLAAASSRTVHQLGLWPSATIDLYFDNVTESLSSTGPKGTLGSTIREEDVKAFEYPAAEVTEPIGLNGDEHSTLDDITWTVVVKPVHSPADRVTVKYLKPSDTVHVLKCR